MTFNIHEALQLPVMKNTKLVTGHDGVTNNIKWVTIVEVLEDIQLLQTGEFLITTGFGIHNNPDRKAVFLKLIKSQKLSGIAICTSFYMKEIPKSFITAAKENHLPLIEIPTNIKFSEITKAILEQIVNNQIHLLEYSSTIHRQLTSLVLNSRSLNEITNTLAELTSSTVLIFNDLYDVIHHTKHSDYIFKPNKTSIVFNNIEIELKVELDQSYINEATIHKVISNYKITICPIIAKEHCYGWVALIKPLEDWKDLDEIAIEHAATIYAIEFLKKQAVEETKIRLQGDFLEDIFSQSYVNERKALEQGKKLGYDLSLKQTVFYLTFKDPAHLNEKLLGNLFHIIEQLLEQKGKQHLIQTKFDSLILLTNIPDHSKQDAAMHCIQLATELKKQWLYFFPNNPLIIGIGKDYNTIHQLYKSVREAQYAVKLASLLHEPDNIIHYSDLGMYDLLLEMHRSGMDLTSIYKETLHTLLPINDNSIDLIETLDVYILNNQVIQKASSQLFIHRHTLRYRLNQIEDKTGLDFKSTDDRLKLQLSVMAYKLEKLLNKNNL